jgi:hypothetical protein
MSARHEMSEAVREALQKILQQYDQRVPARSVFKDVTGGARLHFGDPSITLPGRIELAVMHMDAQLDREYDSLRFLAIRVWKSPDGGMASTTCFHATAQELKEELEGQLHDPSFIVDRIEELAHGLPEETNPNIWR